MQVTEKGLPNTNYYYGVEDKTPIDNALRKASEIFEKTHDDEELKAKVVPHIVVAYQSILDQTSFDFDPQKAAMFSLKILMGNRDKWKFERKVKVREILYSGILECGFDDVARAASLRVFMNDYQSLALENCGKLSIKDREVIQLLNQRSSEILDSIISKV